MIARGLTSCGANQEWQHVVFAGLVLHRWGKSDWCVAMAIPNEVVPSGLAESLGYEAIGFHTKCPLMLREAAPCWEILGDCEATVRRFLAWRNKVGYDINVY